MNVCHVSVRTLQHFCFYFVIVRADDVAPTFMQALPVKDLKSLFPEEWKKVKTKGASETPTEYNNRIIRWRWQMTHLVKEGTGSGLANVHADVDSCNPGL